MSLFAKFPIWVTAVLMVVLYYVHAPAIVYFIVAAVAGVIEFMGRKKE